MQNKTEQKSISRLLVPVGRMWRIPHFCAFLPEIDRRVIPYVGGRFDAVCGWGKKPTSVKPRALAKKKGVPYIGLEDGFLRSFDLGINKAPPLSLVMDRSGIYYDSTAPSDLEKILQHKDFTKEECTRAQRAMDWICSEKLSKYNKGLLPYQGTSFKRLIIDQTAGDASVVLSGAAENAFETMIEDAIKAHGADAVAVKLHPDTMTGKKGGYLRQLAGQYGLQLITEKINPWELFNACEEISVISSQMGFEALMAGKKVICYGMPFYAGWGLTEDRVSCPRRTRKRRVAEVFAAAYIDYARYIDPYTGTASTLENTIGLLSDLVRYERKAKTKKTAVGFSLWRRSFTPHFAGTGTIFRGRVADGNRMPVLIWASKYDRIIKKGRIPANANVMRMEDGFVRSRGLGVKLTRPWSLVLDDEGIYYDPRSASELETILQNTKMSEGLLARAAAVRRMLVDRAVSKYNTGTMTTPHINAKGRPVLLVVGQVEDDASIRTGTDHIATNADLLREVRRRNPDSHIIYKPHPDIEAGKRKGKVPPDVLKKCADQIISGCSITQLWPVIDALHTMTSLSGFEALLREKKVYTYGRPFYAGWGLTVDDTDCPRRRRHLTIDHLVAGTLILYPLYFDWKTRQPCNVETVIRRLSAA